MTAREINSLEWNEVRELAEKIISNRVTTKVLKSGTVNRPMRFSEIADEIPRIPLDTLYCWIRGDRIPRGNKADLIREWCIKHRSVLTK